MLQISRLTRLLPRRGLRFSTEATNASAAKPATTVVESSKPAALEAPTEDKKQDSGSGGGSGEGSGKTATIAFFVGFSLAGAMSAVYLSNDFQASSEVLERKIGDLQAATDKYIFAVNDVNRLADEVKKLHAAMATKQEVAGVRSDIAMATNQLEVSFAEHKAAVWETQQEMHRVVQKLASSAGPTLQ